MTTAMALREKIAIYLKLDRIEPLRRANRRGDLDKEGVRLLYCESHHGGAANWEEVPNYTSDLRAVQQAAGKLDRKTFGRYARTLVMMASGRPDVTMDSLMAVLQMPALTHALAFESAIDYNEKKDGKANL